MTLTHLESKYLTHLENLIFSHLEKVPHIAAFSHLRVPQTFTYARLSTYDNNISCIYAVILFTSIVPSDGRQIWYNLQELN